ncbi:MAG TPA: hypothetical protein VGR71_17185, partial [Nitrospira sp.]|nr:hypothetical protein [Nitrospira sp.]
MRLTTIAIVGPLCVFVLLVATASQTFAQTSVSQQSIPTMREPAAPAPRVASGVDGVLDLFKQKSVVALADAHGLAQEEAFYSALVRDPRFAKDVGNVVVEFGGSGAQNIIDRYENGGD